MQVCLCLVKPEFARVLGVLHHIETEASRLGARALGVRLHDVLRKATEEMEQASRDELSSLLLTRNSSSRSGLTSTSTRMGTISAVDISTDPLRQARAWTLCAMRGAGRPAPAEALDLRQRPRVAHKAGSVAHRAGHRPGGRQHGRCQRGESAEQHV